MKTKYLSVRKPGARKTAVARARRFISLVCLCVTLAVQAVVLPQANNSQHTAADILARSTQIAALVGDALWQGFDMRRYAFVNLAADAKGLTMGFSDAPDHPERRTLLMSYDFKGLTAEDAIALAFHESFHVFAADNSRPGSKWRRENSMLVAEYPETDARLAALFAIEGRLLQTALRALANRRDTDAAKQAARQFLALRRLRHAEMPARFLEFEKGVESNEGLAEYAGAQAICLAIRAANNRQLAMTFRYADEQQFLENRFATLATITDAGKNSRLRFYFTGAAQAFLLDRLLPDWKRRVQFDAAPLQDLLAEATQFSEAAAPPLAEAALRDYEYAAVLEREKANTAARLAQKQAVLDGVLRQAGRRYVFDVSAFEKMGDIRLFDPMNVTVVNPEQRVHTRLLHIGGDKGYSGEFTGAVIEDSAQRQYLTIVSGDREEVTADGAPIDVKTPGEYPFKEKLLIKTARFTFAASAGVVLVSDTGVTIKLLPPSR